MLVFGGMVEIWEIDYIFCMFCFYVLELFVGLGGVEGEVEVGGEVENGNDE